MRFQGPGFAAYRAVVDVGKMRRDPDLSWILEKPALNIWYSFLSLSNRVPGIMFCLLLLR